jgi:membrane protein
MIDRAKNLWQRLDRWMDGHRATRVARRSTVDFLSHEALTNAGSMAYFAMLSIFQLLVLTVVLLSLFLGDGEARTYVLNQVDANTPIGRETAAAVIDAVISSRGGISIVGFVLLLWSALGAFSALNRGIARAFVAAAPRPFWRDKLVGLGVMAVAGSLGVASIIVGFLADLVESIAADAVAAIPGAGLALDLLSLTIPILLIFGVFLAVYRITPNRPVALREVWPGAVVATILWTALRIGFTYYAAHVARYDSAFGPISTGVSLLVFLYFDSVVVLLGAEVARANVLEDERKRAEAAAASLEKLREHDEPRRGLPRWATHLGNATAGLIVRRLTRRDPDR